MAKEYWNIGGSNRCKFEDNMEYVSTLDRLKKPHWITADGRKLSPKDMEDKHLKNVIKFLEEQASWWMCNECCNDSDRDYEEFERFCMGGVWHCIDLDNPLKWLKTKRIYKELVTEWHVRKKNRPRNVES